MNRFRETYRVTVVNIRNSWRANRIDAFYSAPPQGCILEKEHLILKWKYNLKNVTEENKDY